MHPVHTHSKAKGSLAFPSIHANSQWVTSETIPNLFTDKLPNVFLHPSKSKGKKCFKENGAITMHKEIAITPAPSANTIAKFNGTNNRVSGSNNETKKVMKSTALPVLPKSYQDKQPYDLIETVEMDKKKVGRETMEVSTPYHITTPNTTLFNSIKPHQIKELEMFPVDSSFYNRPKPINPFCLASSTNEKNPPSWRDTQLETFLWESQYLPSRIHDNFLHNKLEKYYRKRFSDYLPFNEAIAKVYSHKSQENMHYQYPDRFLPVDASSLIKKPPQTQPEDKLDFLLAISELKRLDRMNISRLNTAIQEVAIKEERRRKNMQLLSREKGNRFIRKQYKLNLEMST